MVTGCVQHTGGTHWIAPVHVCLGSFTIVSLIESSLRICNAVVSSPHKIITPLCKRDRNSESSDCCQLTSLGTSTPCLEAEPIFLIIIHDYEVNVCDVEFILQQRIKIRKEIFSSVVTEMD